MAYDNPRFTLTSPKSIIKQTNSSALTNYDRVIHHTMFTSHFIVIVTSQNTRILSIFCAELHEVDHRILIFINQSGLHKILGRTPLYIYLLSNPFFRNRFPTPHRDHRRKQRIKISDTERVRVLLNLFNIAIKQALPETRVFVP